MIDCILVDDEPLALRLLEKYVERVPDLRLAGTFSRGEEALQRICGGGVDLAFLDIQMPGINGLELARAARANDTKVVFVTAYRDFAVDGFRVAAIDYLLKPVSFDEFSDAIARYRGMSAAYSPAAEAAEAATAEVTDTITIKSDYRSVPVKTAEILYVEGLKDYVKIFLKGRERPLLTQMSLKALEGMLPATRFIRVHRSYITALEHITSYTRSHIKTGAADLPIGDTYRAKVLSVLGTKGIRI